MRFGGGGPPLAEGGPAGLRVPALKLSLSPPLLRRSELPGGYGPREDEKGGGPLEPVEGVFEGHQSTIKTKFTLA